MWWVEARPAMRPGRGPWAEAQKGGPSEVRGPRARVPDVGPRVGVLRVCGPRSMVPNRLCYGPISRIQGYRGPNNRGRAMSWAEPPPGSPRALALRELRRHRSSDWDRVARGCRGYDGARLARLAREAYEGGAPGMAWCASVFEAAGSASPPKEGVRGRPRSERGRLAYEARERGGTWAEVAREVGFSDAGNGNVAKKAARRHAEHAGLPWPVGGS